MLEQARRPMPLRQSKPLRCRRQDLLVWHRLQSKSQLHGLEELQPRVPKLSRREGVLLLRDSPKALEEELNHHIPTVEVEVQVLHRPRLQDPVEDTVGQAWEQGRQAHLVHPWVPLEQVRLHQVPQPGREWT